jgi:hypothetical protein
MEFSNPIGLFASLLAGGAAMAKKMHKMGWF